MGNPQSRRGDEFMNFDEDDLFGQCNGAGRIVRNGFVIETDT